MEVIQIVVCIIYAYHVRIHNPSYTIYQKNCSLRTMAQSHFFDKSCLNFISNLIYVWFFFVVVAGAPLNFFTTQKIKNTLACCIRCPKGFNSDTQRNWGKKEYNKQEFVFNSGRQERREKQYWLYYIVLCSCTFFFFALLPKRTFFNSRRGRMKKKEIEKIREIFYATKNLIFFFAPFLCRLKWKCIC